MVTNQNMFSQQNFHSGKLSAELCVIRGVWVIRALVSLYWLKSWPSPSNYQLIPGRPSLLLLLTWLLLWVCLLGNWCRGGTGVWIVSTWGKPHYALSSCSDECEVCDSLDHKPERIPMSFWGSGMGMNISQSCWAPWKILYCSKWYCCPQETLRPSDSLRRPLVHWWAEKKARHRAHSNSRVWG